MTDDKDAEELTQGYFQKFGGFTCSWENVQQIISEMLESENALKETLARAGYRIAELKNEIDELKEKIADLESIVESLQSCTNCEHFDGDNYCKSKQCIVRQLDGYCPNWEKAE